MKDLWIFSGFQSSDHFESPESPDASVSGSTSDLRKAASMSESHSNTETTGRHRRLATAPAGISSFPPTQPFQVTSANPHTRAAREAAGSQSVHPSTPFTRNRISHKAAPRAQVPVSVIVDVPEGPGQRQENKELSSAQLQGINNMADSPSHDGLALRQDVTYALDQAGPDQLARSRSLSSQTSGQSRNVTLQRSASVGRSNAAPLLGPKVFGVGASVLADSAYEENGVARNIQSCEIPITWTGGAGEAPSRDGSGRKKSEKGSPKSKLPGAWSNEEEDTEQEITSKVSPTKGPVTPVHDVDVRVGVPEVKHVDIPRLNSQVGIVEMIPPRTQSPLSTKIEKDSENDRERKRERDEREKDRQTDRDQGKNKPKRKESDKSGQGWVLVNFAKGQLSSEQAQSLDALSSSEFPATSKANGGVDAVEAGTAKTIAILDALDARPKSKSKDSKEATRSGPGGLRKLFALSIGGKRSPASNSEESTQLQSQEAKDGGEKEKVKQKTGLRSKLKRTRTSESSKDERSDEH